MRSQIAVVFSFEIGLTGFKNRENARVLQIDDKVRALL